MDYNHTFRQAHQDRLEDAGIKHYGRQNSEGYVIIEERSNPERKTAPRLVKRLALAMAQLLVKQ